MRVHVVPPRLPRRLHLAHLPGRSRTDERPARTGCRRGRPTARESVSRRTRDGNPELYVMTADGSNLVRLTNNPAIDTSPTWSTERHADAFTSDRSGSPQIYIVMRRPEPEQITSESCGDRPTWSPAPFNRNAYASRTGPGYDIRITTWPHRSAAAESGQGSTRARVRTERPARDRSCRRGRA